MIKIKPISAFSDNYIWLLVLGEKAFAVDPGDADPLIAFVNKNNLSLEGAMITHHHFDHSGGIEKLLSTFNLKIFGPKGGHIKGITNPLEDNEEFDVLGRTFTAMSVPGHTDDQLAYFSKDQFTQPILFSGDTLFAAGCGRLFEGTPEQMYSSLTRFSLLPLDTLVYCGHEYTLANLNFAKLVEPSNQDINKRLDEVRDLRSKKLVTLPSSIKLELKTNPFMRCNTRSVKNAAEEFFSKQLDNEIAVLGAVREWKDTI
jgi:hydroxyacylglutathione hydrolase